MSGRVCKASVIIPVKNGGELLGRVLDAVLTQNTDWPFELLVIDSGSRDGSQQRVRERGIRLHEIPPAEFGHGRTRNLGAALTSGEFIVFLTHDALPADAHWLARLVAAAELSTDTAGAFGRHFAYPDSGPVIERDLREFFRGFGDQPNLIRMDDAERYRREEGYRQFLHFFSSNNACLRRSVWELIPLPDVDFAEDQLWARTVIEAGYAKAYAPDACVYHSHTLGVFESYRRAFDEAGALQRLFGYEQVPNVRHLLKHAWLLSRRDWGWIGEARLGRRQRLRWQWRAPWVNLARLSGLYLGGRQGVPGWLAERSSRDRALQRS
jgi:rhamnosyltransferase